jgi:spermidine synthase
VAPDQGRENASGVCDGGGITRVKSFALLGQAVPPGGTEMKLVCRGDEYIILADGKPLMSSRMHGSEEALAAFACERARAVPRACVLIGGLGMGFTLRATLDLLAPDATVVVAELVSAVVEWNRGVLGSLAGEPMKDGRARVEIEDVAVTMNSRRGQFDAVMIDVDNDPTALTGSSDMRLYDQGGIAAAYAALKMDGVLAVWSVREDRKYEERLRRGGFAVEVKKVRGRLARGGPRHTIFLGRKGAWR